MSLPIDCGRAGAVDRLRGLMRLCLAFGVLYGLALWGQATSPAQAQTECPYLTRPRVESENGATRVNQWAEGTVLCFRSRVLRCEAAAWHDQGECPDSAKWKALEATFQEQSARPVGMTTPAPAIPPDAPLAVPTQTVSPVSGASSKEVDMTLAAPTEPTPAAKAIGMPTGSHRRAAELASPPEPQLGPSLGPSESATEAPANCSDMQRLSFERVFNKSLAESQRCQAACTTEDCKHDCENQHESVRSPRIMERFHADACSPVWYP
jgi:hypothetical protein